MNETAIGASRTDSLSLRGGLSVGDDPATPRGGLSAVQDWHCAFWFLVLQTQAETLRQWTALQKATLEVQQDTWERIVCRFGGGVPLDG